MNTLSTLIVSFISYIVLDLLWLGVIAKPFITRSLAPWMGELKLFPAFLVYGLLALGTTFFVLPKTTGFGTAFLWGSFLGLIIYGVYDMTNLATIAQWPIRFAIVDMIWGMVSGGFVAMILITISYYFK